MKLVLTLILSSILGYRCQDDTTIAALAHQINTLKINISVTIGEDGHLIGLTRAAISGAIGQAQGNIQTQLDQLDQIVAEAKTEAVQKSVDISPCLQALVEVDVGTLRSCEEDLRAMESKLGQLGALRRRLGSAISDCSGQGHVGEALQTCVQEVIRQVADAQSTTHEEVVSGCDQARRNAVACTQVLLGRLDKTLDQVAHELKTCLLNLL